MGEVRFDKVTKTFDSGITVVQDLNLFIEDKEFVVLVGPSGCGKTTTLRMIAGLEEITSGTIAIDNIVVNDIPPKDRNIAMVFQNYALYPHMNVFENMAFGLKLRKADSLEIINRVKKVANILGINQLLDRKPKDLSGGQRQRVALGRAIVRQPKVFLFDEPLSNLDANLRVQMRTEISRLHHQLETTMIYVTHDQVEAMSMGDRIVVMKNGFIHQVDTPLNIYNNPSDKFVASFIGSPTINFFNGRIKNQGELIFIDITNYFQLPIPTSLRSRILKYVDKEIILGIRPENFHTTQITQTLEEASIKVNIEVIETVGNEMFVYFSLKPEKSKEQFVARTSPTSELKVGNEFTFYVDIQKLHFFDPITEKSL